MYNSNVSAFKSTLYSSGIFQRYRRVSSIFDLLRWPVTTFHLPATSKMKPAISSIPCSASFTQLASIREIEQAWAQQCRAAQLENLSKLPFSPQLDCPVFALPREIRDLVWEFALSADPFVPEKTRPARDHHLASVPVHYHTVGAPRTLPTALLRTCKRVYFETYHMPLR